VLLFLGDDWAEESHDVELQDQTGRVLARAKLPEGMTGMARLHAMVGEHVGDDEDVTVVVGIETDRGPWVQALVAAGYRVYAINPLQVARYRERHGVSGAKSDSADTHVICSMVQTDHHRLRQALLDFFPAALAAFDDLTAPDALQLLAAAPDPASAAALRLEQITDALKRARRRNRAIRAEQIATALRDKQLGQPPVVAAAYAATVRAQAAILTVLNTQIKAMEEQVEAHFGKHPDAKVYLSQPGLGPVLGARVLAEFGDDKQRYADAKARKNYAGTSPITRQSGKRKVVLARWVHNDRLIDALGLQAFCALSVSPGARAYYDQLRARGVGHRAATRQLGNRLVGILHGCLKTGIMYDEARAWNHQQDKDLAMPLDN
jgi:transposase